MKKLIYILVALTAFSIGFWLFHLRPLVTPVSLCEISQHAELFKSKQIRVKAFLDGVGRDESNLDDYSVSDFRNGCLTGASLEISEKIKEKLKSDENLKGSISLLRQKYEEAFDNRRNPSYPAGYYLAEVEITGEIEKYTETETTSIARIPFKIKVDEIKQVSPIQFISHEEFSNITNLK